MTTLPEAAAAARAGDLIVYPTETVYGLGADALDRDAVEAVYAAKDRDRSEPVSLAVPDLETAGAVVDPTPQEAAFMREFLPGPVTVVLERRPSVPDALTAGRDRVGVRIPDHEKALALLDRVSPLTATSANLSGRPAARRPEALDPEIRAAAATVIDGGETPGGASTVVDVSAGHIHRRGALADRIEAWLQE